MEEVTPQTKGGNSDHNMVQGASREGLLASGGRRGSAPDSGVGGRRGFTFGWCTPPQAWVLFCLCLRERTLKKLKHFKHVSSPFTPCASFRKHLLEETFQRK